MVAAVAQFALPSLVAVVLLGVVAVAVTRRAGTDESINDAKRITALLGHGVVEPGLSDDLVRGDPKAIAALDRIVRDRVTRDPVVRVKIWTPSGRIVYSDARELIGSRYGLSADDRQVFTTGATEAEVSDLSRPENRLERPFGKLLEVYLPIRTTSGQPLLFESYQRFSSVAASGRRLWAQFAPALIGALLLLYLVQLPLAYRMARRIRVAQREREGLLMKAIESSDTERRRIARDLHDGPVQNLAGVSYSLAAAADRAAAAGAGNGGGDGPAGEDLADTLRSGSAATRASIADLRTLLVGIYPPSLERSGLSAALGDLLRALERQGVETRLEIADDLELPPAISALFFRTAQEALRNVAKHAEAGSVRVAVGIDGGCARLTVADDGRGFAVAATGGGPGGEGHMGLSLLADLASEAGAELSIDSRDGEGTTVAVEAPLT
jgi:signal transduction histidine kinase